MVQMEPIEIQLSPATVRGERFRSAGPSQVMGDSLLIGLPPEMRAVVEREALRTGRTAEGLMRDAVSRYLMSLPPALLD